ncbi:MAG: cytochrome P450 [Rhizobiales bacterium]|nr:cytochrome P450 [Hyphomicrobiales bacterium]
MGSTLSTLDPYSIPIEKIDVSNPALFQDDTVGSFFKRLREEDPVHFCSDSKVGPFWSITKFNDIVDVDSNHAAFSSDASNGGVALENRMRRNFIAMDPPKHDEQRKAVSPIVAPPNLRNLEGLIRERTAAVLDDLPRGTEFDWVKRVSIDLTTKMLATLFDFPYEERHLLTEWSDISVTVPIESDVERERLLRPCYDYFGKLWTERQKQPPKADLLSMLAHSDAAKRMDVAEFNGNVLLLIVGGNDTTRNTMTASILAMHQNPGELEKLRKNPELIPSMVSETIRWQTPLSHMRRTATADVWLRGKHIRKGDKIAMWYLSGNRDDEYIERADEYIIDRKNVRQHLSFGFGIHRCVGNRLAELQLKILWEELLKRNMTIEVLGPPVRTYSNFIHGYESLPVKVSS